MKKTASILAASAAVILVSAPAQAQSFRELMEDIGIQKREQPKMDFNERPPLVIPPSAALPPPEDGTSLASVNPNWPSDPDDAVSAAEEERKRVPDHMRRKYRDNAAQDIYEIRAQEREAARTAPSKGYDTIFDRRQVMTPAELRAVRDNQAAQPEQAYVEPERARLTDPPPGYRSPSPNQPFGPGEKEKKSGSNWLSKLNPFN